MSIYFYNEPQSSHFHTAIWCSTDVTMVTESDDRFDPKNFKFELNVANFVKDLSSHYEKSVEVQNKSTSHISECGKLIIKPGQTVSIDVDKVSLCFRFTLSYDPWWKWYGKFPLNYHLPWFYDWELVKFDK